MFFTDMNNKVKFLIEQCFVVHNEQELTAAKESILIIIFIFFPKNLKFLISLRLFLISYLWG